MADPKTSLRVAISGDLADIKSALVKLDSQLGGVGRTGAKAGAEASRGLAGIDGAASKLRGRLTGLFAGLTVGAFFKGILDNTRESEAALAQLNAGLASTKGIAGVTASEISALADSLASVTTFGDDAIVSMASVLATFTNIRTTVFKDAIPAILDLSTRLGTDLNSAAIQVGKALNDPIKGISALAKAGVQFTPYQQQLIEGFVETGRVAEAQRIILDELATQMGGSAAAAADTLAGSIDQAKNAFGNLLEGDSSSGGLLEVKTAFQQLTATLNDPAVQSGFQAIISFLGQAAAKAALAASAIANMINGVDAFGRSDAEIAYQGNLGKEDQLRQQIAAFEKNGRTSKMLPYSGLSESQLYAEFAQVKQLTEAYRSLGVAASGGRTAAPDRTSSAFPLDGVINVHGGDNFGSGAGAAAEQAANEAKRKLEALRRAREQLLKESKKADADRVKDLLELEAKVTSGMADIEIALKRAMGDEAGAAFDEIDQKYAQLITDLKEAGTPAGIAIVERLINLEKVDAQLAQFKAKMEEASSASQATIGSLSGQAAGGLITGSEADRGRADALARELAIQQQLLVTAQRYLGTLSAGSPEATKTLAFIEQLNGRIGEVQATQNQFVAQVKDQAVSSLKNFFMDLATGAKSFKDAFKDMLRSFLSGVAEMIAQKLALKAVDAIFGAFHSGGIVGMGGSLRSGINPMVFGFAPRYHSGGIAGLAPNETAAILQKGEEVLTRNDPRHRRNAGAGGAARANKTVILFDANAVADHMVSGPGEQAFLHLVGRNSGAIREILS